MRMRLGRHFYPGVDFVLQVEISAVDPEDLQKEADTLPKSEILSRYTRVSSPQEYIDAYKPLITVLSSDIVCIQTTSVNQEELINMLGKEVLPKLK